MRPTNSGRAAANPLRSDRKMGFDFPRTRYLYKLVNGFEHHLIYCDGYVRLQPVEDTIQLFIAKSDAQAIEISGGITYYEDCVRYLLKLCLPCAFADAFPEVISGDAKNIRSEVHISNNNLVGLNRCMVGKISVVKKFHPKKSRCIHCDWAIHDARTNKYFPFCTDMCAAYFDPMS